MESKKQSPLEIIEIGHPTLRQKARALEVEEILTPVIQELIEAMRVTMREAPGVGLAAPQVGIPLQLLVIEDRAEYHKKLTKEQFIERERSVVPFHVIINPKIYFESQESALFFEGCLSYPGVLGLVSRATAVRVECLNEKGEQVVIHARGWYARILQHEIDHLFGTLCIDHTKTKSITTFENYDKFWKNEPIEKVRSLFR